MLSACQELRLIGWKCLHQTAHTGIQTAFCKASIRSSLFKTKLNEKIYANYMAELLASAELKCMNNLSNLNVIT